jgi:hypothetical protein
MDQAQIDANYSQRRIGFNPRAVHVAFVVVWVVLWQVFLRVLRFSLPANIPSLFYAHILPPLRCAIGPTSQHVITTSVINQGFTLDSPLGWAQEHRRITPANRSKIRQHEILQHSFAVV